MMTNESGRWKSEVRSSKSDCHVIDSSFRSFVILRPLLGLDQPLHVLGQDVGFEVHPAADCRRPSVVTASV